MTAMAGSEAHRLGTSVFVQETTGDAVDGKLMKFVEAQGTGEIH